MNKRYLRFNKNKNQKSFDNDELVLDLGKNIQQSEMDSIPSKLGIKTDSRSSSNMYGNKDMSNNPESQDAEALKNMKRIWKKAIFSIKKETKPKAGPDCSKPYEEEIAPLREVPKSTRNLGIDPIYLMLRKAACKTSDGTEPAVEEEKRMSNESCRSEREVNRRESSTKTPSNEDMRKIQESSSATKIHQRRRIDQRMKSLSVDNPEVEIICNDNDNDNDCIYEQSKKFSSSFTNNSAIESTGSCHPLRKKYMNEQHRSISMENESQPITTTGYDSYRSSCSIKSNELLSPRQSTKYINAVADEPRHNSQSSISKVNLRANRGNWKMKSFSVDVPDGDMELSTTSSQLAFKANSHTSSPIRERNAYYKTSESPGYDSQRSHSNLYGSKRSPRGPVSELNPSESMVNNTQIRHKNIRNEFMYDNIPVDNRRLSNNSYVVLFDFYARRSDELDLKAGWRVAVLNCSDPDWWTGKCNGRIGYFPSTYVQKIQHGDSVWKIVRDISLDDDDGNTFKLHKGEIAVQKGSQDGETIPICIKRTSNLWCPIDYVGKIFDDYI